MSKRAVNAIDVVEAAYQMDGTDEEWLRTVATGVRPLLDGGCGMTSYFYDATVPPSDWLATCVAFDMSAERLRIVEETMTAHAQMVATFHELPEPLDGSAVAAFRRNGSELPRFVYEIYKRLGVRDFSALRTIEPGGKGVTFVAGQVSERRYHRRASRLWSRVAAHIAAGRRLRAALVEAPLETGVEAVLTPSGKLDHADGEAKPRNARDALREAVLRQERARSCEGRKDPESATEAWTALVSGRWSLVDRFERSGRRYVIARRNEHSLEDPRALSICERTTAHLAALGKSNKLIAYELGLAESTVGTQLSTVMRKLGVTSRVGLIRSLAGLQ